jgi:molybdenum cofactor biosynthesis protein B
MSETARGHKEEAPKKLQFGIYICSTSRYEQMKKGQKVEDASGGLIESLLENAGHTVSFRKIISDDPDLITQSVQYIIDCADIDAAVFCGGTGITHSDVTIETVTPFLERVLPGFGEIFRRLSYDENIHFLSQAMTNLCREISEKLGILILTGSGHRVRHARE